MIVRFFKRYRDNFALLRRAADKIGREFEKKSHSELAGGSSDQEHGEFAFQEVKVRYSAYSYSVKKNGDICFCIDLYAELPTFLGIKPSYQFVKRQDGTVYYS